jgi:hypothetical protein
MYNSPITAPPRSRTPQARRWHAAPSCLAGGQSLLPAMKLRLAAPAALVSTWRHRRAWPASACDGGTIVDRRADAPRRGGRSAEVRQGHPGAGRAGRPHRRPRRCATAARSAARWPTTTRPPTTRGAAGLGATVVTNKRRSRRRLLQGPVRDGAGRRRDHHRGELPGAGEGRLRRSSATRPRASRWSACSSAKTAPACASRSPAPAPACSASKRNGSGAGRQLVAGSARTASRCRRRG